MKITVTKPEDLYEGSMEIEIETAEGRKSCRFGSGEPEDFCLARDLKDAFSIDKMLILAYNAGKNNEELEIVNLEE